MTLDTKKTEGISNDLRRALLKAGATASVAGMTGLISGGVFAAGSDKPEKEEVKVGFIPLTDCASVVMASVLGFDKKYGIKIIPSKESSWASVRDKLVKQGFEPRTSTVTQARTLLEQDLVRWARVVSELNIKIEQ